LLPIDRTSHSTSNLELYPGTSFKMKAPIKRLGLSILCSILSLNLAGATEEGSTKCHTLVANYTPSFPSASFLYSDNSIPSDLPRLDDKCADTDVKCKISIMIDVVSSLYSDNYADLADALLLISY
jgi:hypothetical protein